MSITLSWFMNNASTDVVTKQEIYRSLDKTTVYQPGNKVGEVVPTEYTFIDSTALDGVPYFYGVRVVFASGQIDGRVRCAAFIPDLGPGSLSVGSGDYEAGTMNTHILGLTADAYNLLKGRLSTANQAVITATSSTFDYKVVSNGKICYIPGPFFFRANTGAGAAGSAIYSVSEIIRNEELILTAGGRDYRIMMADFEFARNFMNFGNILSPTAFDEKILITMFHNRPPVTPVTNNIALQLVHPGPAGSNTPYKRTTYTPVTNAPGTITRFADYSEALIGNTSFQAVACIYFELLA